MSIKSVIFRYNQEIPILSMENNSIYLCGAAVGPFIDVINNRYSFDCNNEQINNSFFLHPVKQVWNFLNIGFNQNGLDVIIKEVNPITSLSLWLLRQEDRKVINERKITNIIDKLSQYNGYFFGATSNLHNALLHDNMEQTLDLLWKDQALIDNWYRYGDQSLPESSLLNFNGYGFGIDIYGKLNDYHGVISLPNIFDRGAIIGVMTKNVKEHKIEYIVGKKSEFINFDMNEFVRLVNLLDGEGNEWSIDNIISKSPLNGSMLSYNEIKNVIVSIIKS